MAFKERTANLINNRADANEVIRASKQNLDWNGLMKTASNIYEEHLVKEDKMNFLKIKSEFDRANNEYMNTFNDPLLYKNQSEVETKKKEFKTIFDKIGEKARSTKLSTETYEKLSEHMKTTVDNSNQVIGLKEKAELFQQQQAEINSILADNSDIAMSASLMGMDGVPQFENAVRDIDGILADQVSKNYIDPTKAREQLSDTLAMGGLNATVVTGVKSILGGGGDNLSKIQKLAKYKKQIKDPQYLKQLAKQFDGEYNNSTLESLEVALNKNVSKVTGMIDSEINDLRTQDEIARTRKARENQDKLVKYQLNNQILELKSKGLFYDAETTLADFQGKNLEYKNAGSYFTMKQDELFEPVVNADGTTSKVNLNDINDNTVVKALPQVSRNVITNILADKEGATGMSLSTNTPEEITIATYRQLVNSVASTLGGDEYKVMATKLIAGSGVTDPMVAPTGFDIKLLKDVALDDGTIMSPSERETIAEDISTLYQREIQKQVVQAATSVDKKDKKFTENIMKITQQGYILPDVVVKGKGDKMFTPDDFRGRDITRGKITQGEFVDAGAKTINKLFETYKPTASKEEKLLYSVQVNNWLSNPAFLKNVENTAIIKYQNKLRTEGSNFYEDGNYNKGVTKAQLVNSGAFGEALEAEFRKVLFPENSAYGTRTKRTAGKQTFTGVK